MLAWPGIRTEATHAKISINCHGTIGVDRDVDMAWLHRDRADGLGQLYVARHSAEHAIKV